MESFRLPNGEKGYRMVANSPQGQIEINPSSTIDIRNLHSDVPVRMQHDFLELNRDQQIYSFTPPNTEFTVFHEGVEVPSGEVNLTGNLYLNLRINNVKIRGIDRTAIEKGISKGFHAKFRLLVNDPSAGVNYTEYLLETPANRATAYFEQFIGQVIPNQPVYCQYNISINHTFENIKIGKFRKEKPVGTVRLSFNGGYLNSDTIGIFECDLSMARIPKDYIINLKNISPDILTLRISNQKMLLARSGIQISKSSGEYFYYRNKESGTDLGYNLGFKGTIDTKSNIPYLICGGSVNPEGSKDKVIAGTFHSTQGSGVGEYKIILPDFMRNNEDYIVQLTVSGEWGGNGADNHANFSRRDTVNNCFYVKTYNGTTLENAGFTFMVYKAEKKI